jgi:hypothetical protein
MAKAIKFNLVLDGRPVRNLDDLRDNFNIEDVLVAFRNGSLARWLETRGLVEEIAALEKIQGDDLDAARELCRVFHGDCTEQQIEAAAYPFEFRQKEAEKLRQYQNLKKQEDEIIRAYHEGYEKLLKEIDDKGEDYPFVKSGVAELFRNYVGLYQLDAEAFYGRFIKDHPLVILAMLANDDMRNLIARQPGEIYGDLGETLFHYIQFPYSQPDIDAFVKKFNKDNNQPQIERINVQKENLSLRKRGVWILILDCNGNPQLNGKVLNSSELGNYYPYTYVPCDSICSPSSSHVTSFAGVTEGYWKDVQAKGKSFLIIKMEEGNFIRNAGKGGEELSAKDVNGKFLILDGIDYKSNNAAHRLVYMEV